MKLAESILTGSTLPRREAVLVSDFQKTGWSGSEDVRFGEGVTLTPVSVATETVTNIAVPSISFARSTFSNQERVTVTAGIVSAKGRSNRDLPGLLGGTYSISDFLQTDAAINPGNSGGPMVDMQGRVVGINSAIVTGSRGNDGVGFAITDRTIDSHIRNLRRKFADAGCADVVDLHAGHPLVVLGGWGGGHLHAPFPRNGGLHAAAFWGAVGDVGDRQVLPAVLGELQL